MDELVEERPVPGALVRHRGARMEHHGVERSAPRLEVHAGAVWIRATEAGPGILATHGATTVQVREGAAVLEVSDFEALLVVVSGRAAVKGAAALPRSVTAGHAVTLNLDGGFGTPEPLTPEELHADRFVVENLARDVLVEAEASPEPGEVAPPPLTAPAGARVDGTPPEAPAGEPGPSGLDVDLDPAPADEPVDETPAATAIYDPVPLPVPTPGGDPGEGGEGAERPDGPGDPRPPRRGLVAVVVVLVILAAVIGAIVLTGDDVRSIPPDEALPSSAPTEPIVTPEATLRGCEATSAGYEAQGVVSSGGDDVARYEVGVGLEDSGGTLYAEKAVVVDARTDPTVAVRWTVELALAADEIRPDSECRITTVDALT